MILQRIARVTTVGVLALTAMAGLVAPASAATASARAGLASVATAALPNVNIQGSPATWNPTTLSVKPKTYHDSHCPKSREVWTITNQTAKSQTISYKIGSGKKTALGRLVAGEKAGVCIKGPARTKFTYYIKGSSSTLAVTLK